MKGKTKAHICLLRVVSHSADWGRVLVSCKNCPNVEVWHPAAPKLRIKVADRKYRPMSAEEFTERLSQMEHLCCG